jgi:hypothetical protein
MNTGPAVSGLKLGVGKYNIDDSAIAKRKWQRTRKRAGAGAKFVLLLSGSNHGKGSNKCF